VCVLCVLCALLLIASTHHSHARASARRPPWDETITDLERHRLTAQEAERKKTAAEEALIAANAERVRRLAAERAKSFDEVLGAGEWRILLLRNLSAPLPDARYHPWDQWDEHLSAGRSGPSPTAV
jgi:hypothetical protein